MVRHLALFILLAVQQAQDPAAEGLKALDAGNHEAAIALFTKAVQADNSDYSAHFNLALAYSLAGRDAEAEASYRKVLELKPGLVQAEINLATVLLRQKKSREAVPLLEAAIQAKPGNPRAHLLLGDALLAAGDASKAEQAYHAALTADPKSAGAEIGLGRALLRQSRLSEAEPHFRRAVELDPSFRQALLQLGEAYEKAGKTDEAVAIYTQFPENAAARERIGGLLLSAGRPKEAIPHFEWALQNAPTAASRIALAQAYRQNGETEKALAMFRAAVDADPNATDLRMIYGRELRDARKFREAAQQFYMVTQAKPGLVEAWSEFAAMLVSLERFPQAIGALNQIRDLGGETAGHVYLRAIVLDRIQDLKGALAAYEHYLSLSQGLNPNEEFKARQRARIINRELEKR
ncbi:MAG TPA: tetratricopeptide repeat protein [Bryobacteraceae bacterium]|nr:tetratricopeptide repeat protein [Bryobacteraceae bacterium]